MLPAAQALLAELDAETVATRRVLERVPEDGFEWRPHPKSFTAGQLAHHLASIPGNLTRMIQQDAVDVTNRRIEYAPASSRAAVLATLDASLATAREFLSGLDEARAHETWRMTAGGRDVLAMPRLSAFRTLVLNHGYHHRGELVVYLRLLEAAVPVVYGPTADENPFVTSAA
jgi:uncharacterized damage-inducible protein DinB